MMTRLQEGRTQTLWMTMETTPAALWTPPWLPCLPAPPRLVRRPLRRRATQRRLRWTTSEWLGSLPARQ